MWYVQFILRSFIAQSIWHDHSGERRSVNGKNIHELLLSTVDANATYFVVLSHNARTRSRSKPNFNVVSLNFYCLMTSIRVPKRIFSLRLSLNATKTKLKRKKTPVDQNGNFFFWSIFGTVCHHETSTTEHSSHSKCKSAPLFLDKSYILDELTSRNNEQKKKKKIIIDDFWSKSLQFRFRFNLNISMMDTSIFYHFCFIYFFVFASVFPRTFYTNTKLIFKSCVRHHHLHSIKFISFCRLIWMRQNGDVSDRHWRCIPLKKLKFMRCAYASNDK